VCFVAQYQYVENSVSEPSHFCPGPDRLTFFPAAAAASSEAPAAVSPTALFASLKRAPQLNLSPSSSVSGGGGMGSPSGGGSEASTSVGTGNLAYDAVQLVNDAVCVALHFNAMLTSVFPDQVSYSYPCLCIASFLCRIFFSILPFVYRYICVSDH
jgi:hypothetical protein